MARNGSGLGKLPANPWALIKAIRSADERQDESFVLSVMVDTSLDPALLAYAKEALRPQTDNLILYVSPYDDKPAGFAFGSQLVIILAGSSTATREQLDRATQLRIPAVVLTLDVALLQELAKGGGDPIDTACIVAVGGRGSNAVRLEALFKELGSWICRQLKEGLLPLARALTFMRRPFVQNAVMTTALQNAAIGGAFFIPGADMPLITLNQAKLLLQIALVYEAEIDMRRFKELGVLLLSAFGLRGLARRLVGVVPLFGWAIRAGIAFSGTYALGEAACRYFEAGGQPKKMLAGLPLIKKVGVHG